MDSTPKIELPQGTLDLLVLRVLAAGDLHGWGIAQRLSVLSETALTIQEGTLYPALYRMEAKGWIAAEWSQSDLGRKAKFYRLTAAGKKRLKVEQDSWSQLITMVAAVLKGA